MKIPAHKDIRTIGMATAIATLAPCDSPQLISTGVVGVEVRLVVMGLPGHRLPDVRPVAVEVAFVVTCIPNAPNSGPLRLRADMSGSRKRICMEWASKLTGKLSVRVVDTAGPVSPTTRSYTE